MALFTMAGCACGTLAAVLTAVQPPAGFVARGIQYPVWLVGITIAALALANAFGEEILWRGALLETQAQWPVAVTYAVQAGSFGLAHLNGTPVGIPGLVVTAAFACAALWCHRRYGLLASIVLHSAADLVLFIEVFRINNA
ncbi:MAG TPA: CPBP family intramembrane glutamic endopeptidase [Galbitalea sp.]|jgi:membrane protease YdiL (CAAX protease family)